MTVYADVLFLVNFCLDYVSLYITGRLLSLKMNVLRLTIGGVVGGIFATISLIFNIDGIIYFALTLSVTFAMTAVSYSRTGAAMRALSALVLFFVGSAIGGLMTAIYSLGRGYRASLVSYSTVPASVFIIVTAGVCLSVMIFGRIAKRRAIHKEMYVTVTVEGKSVRLSALPDSGNLLHEPISGRPVMIVRSAAIKDILPKGMADILASDLPAEGLMKKIPTEAVGRVRIIPVSGVEARGVMLSYRPDSVMIECGGTLRQRDCTLAISVGEDKFGGCDAILPSEII